MKSVQVLKTTPKNNVLERLALETKYPKEMVENLLEIINNTPNQELAIIMLLGYEKTTMSNEELIASKNNVKEVVYESLKFDAWRNTVYGKEVVNDRLDVYVHENVKNPTLEDVVCLYRSERIEGMNILSSSEVKDKKNLKNCYVTLPTIKEVDFEVAMNNNKW